MLPGILQILILLVVIITLFGNFSNILKDTAKGINIFKKFLKK